MLYLTGQESIYNITSGKTLLVSAAENVVMEYGNMYQINTKILRIPHLYSAVYTQDFFYKLFTEAEESGKIVFEESPEQNIYFVCMDDLAELLYKVYDNWGKERCLEWVEMKRGKAEKLSYDVQPTVAHPDEVEGIVQASGIQDYNSMQDTTYEVTDTGLIVHKGIAGTRPDVDALKQQIQTNVTAMNFQDVISCPTAENQLTEPDFAGIASQIYTEPVNATLDPDNGYSVVASKNGTSMDADSAKAEYESAEENTDITIPFTFTEPEITTEKMNANLFKDTLGSYSSSAAGGTSGRIHNVGLTASICNGQIVLPGETFSFNGVVGDTTAEKGYQEAAGYQDGKVVQVLGGGECQVSSTLFSAILYTDLDVLERANHSMPVHYVPSGMDATVFWDSPDFKFENNHKYPVKIVMNMDSSDTLTVKILGTKENDYTIEPRVEQIDEMSNVTYRDYKDASGNVVKSESVCASKYKPLNSGS